MSDPVSWKVVERGWAVREADGEELGRVDEVLGDPEADIFSGLSVSTGTFKRPFYVPAEQVAQIRDGEIALAAQTE
jgi:uncharacterized protein YrrD